jgi:hypothetical protein
MTHCRMNVFVLWKLVLVRWNNRGSLSKGSCPHAAIREDISANLHVLEDLQRLFKTQILLIESGGDNLAANYSRELADYIIYVVITPIYHFPSSNIRQAKLVRLTSLVATRFRAKEALGLRSQIS